MNHVLLCLAFLAGQMNTLQSKPVAHLAPHRAEIEADFGGKVLKLINAPAIVYLPPKPPRTDNEGNPWSVDVMNLGPKPVMVIDNAIPTVKVIVNVNQLMHFYWNGNTYTWTK